ncbi:hypothetical protein [Thalassobacterium maritimum]|nr:hypothetical protein [Coraliomargarita sp. SDUM461003]
MNMIQSLAIIESVGLTVLLGVAAAIVGLLVTLIKMYRKVDQGYALVRNGFGGTQVSFAGMVSVPVLHKLEIMDLRVQHLPLDRRGKDGLICQDNVRADISVGFYVRVNPHENDVKAVAKAVGCERASDLDKIRELFDAKFSEALKTAGKQFDFESLYTDRIDFRNKIIEVIGQDLNGYALEDVAIDYLEQTPLEALNPDNILDSEGIKKIAERTATQAILENEIANRRIQTIKQNDVQRIEAVLEMEKQQAEAEEKQKREISVIRSREEAEAKRVAEEQRLRAEQAQINTDEELQIARENMQRQVIVAEKNKQKTEAVETERVERDRQLEVVERDKVTTLADIEKTKAVEIEKRNIQDVIKERVMVEKTVVIEQEKIKDTESFATADRQKRIAITDAEEKAEREKLTRLKEAEASQEAEKLKADEEYYKEVRRAESSKQATELSAQEMIIAAEAEEAASVKQALAKKHLAEGVAAETAAEGLGDAKVLEARAAASLRQGEADAKSASLKFEADAKGITEKAAAMKLFNEAGKEHEEFKLRLEKDKEVELESIRVNENIARHQAQVLSDSLKNTKVDIVGGSTEFYNDIIGAVTRGKSFERTLSSSPALTDVKETFFNGDPEYFRAQVSNWLKDFNIDVATVKDLSIANLMMKLASETNDEDQLSRIRGLAGMAEKFGLANERVQQFLSMGQK